MRHLKQHRKPASILFLSCLLFGLLILPANRASLAATSKAGAYGDAVAGTQIKLRPTPSVHHLPATTPTPAPTPAKAKLTNGQTVEQNIIQALNEGASYAFQLSDDHVFSNNLDGFITYKQDGKITKTPKSTEWVENNIRDCTKGLTVRIDNGVVSMQDSAKHTCTLNVLPDGQGVSLEIYSVGNSPLDESIIGVISGNTFTASQIHNFATYSAYTKTSRGFLFSGDYRVSLIAASEETLQPKAVEAHYRRNEDYSVTISWTDPNQAGTVAYYEIYRLIGIGSDYTLAATVSDCDSWTDTMQKVKDSYWDILNYYVVAYNSSGVASEMSNILVF